MYKATVTLAAFVVFLGCNADSPTSPGAAKYSEAEAEQCPWPVLGIAGTWAGEGFALIHCPACDEEDNWNYWESIKTADTLRIEFAPDPNPTGEPGVTYYDYTLLSYYSPSEWDDPALADLGLPSLYSERRGKMGVYYAGGGTWAFNQTETYYRFWNAETKEYEEQTGRSWPQWGIWIKMFDDWLVLGWYDLDSGSEYDDDLYERVDE